MPATATQTLAARYTAAFAGSKQRFETAKGVFPTGVTHDARMMDPFPVYVTHAKGAHKWDVDGHRLTDYFVGHGSHMLGHCPDDVVKAVQEQMARGTHHGACHDAEIEWGQLVRKLIPSAERVRFTGSGTEATLMALRLRGSTLGGRSSSASRATSTAGTTTSPRGPTTPTTRPARPACRTTCPATASRSRPTT